MKLPNAEAAIVDIRKIRDYCLSKEHPRGKHKAQLFEDALGIFARHSEELRIALLRAALKEDATLGASDQYGTRYIIDFELERDGKTARIRSCWIILKSEIEPRFVTCFVL
jgi:hypothetical protein